MTTRIMTPAEAQAEGIRHGYLPQWVVTEKPRDYPDKFVARMAWIGVGGIRWTSYVLLGDTLKEVRDQLPPGLVRIPRAYTDQPVIVETWT